MFNKITENLKENDNSKLKDSITSWYIRGTLLLQNPKMNDYDKRFIKSCIDTLNLMCEDL